MRYKGTILTAAVLGLVAAFGVMLSPPGAARAASAQGGWSPTAKYRTPPAPPLQFDSVTLSADAKADGKPLVHFWSTCVGAGRANEGLRASWLEAFRTVHDYCGFQYVRFHGLFHTDMFVLRNGVENWQYVDDLFDRMLAMNVRPFVELGFNPIDPLPPPVAGGRGGFGGGRGPTTGPAGGRGVGQFWWQANASPPSDLGRWGEFVQDFTRHCVDRYGIDEVRQWYFECWNEPNLNAFFRGGTQAQYFALYKASSLAVKKVDPSLRVGGPATSNFTVHLPAGQRVAEVTHAGPPTPDDAEALDWEPVWVADFLTYCSDNKLPVDFVSTHPYPQSFAIDDGGVRSNVRRSIDATHDDLALLRNMVNASPFPNAKIELTEWSSSPSSRDFMHDALCPAAFIVKTDLDSTGLVDALSYWTFTDVFEEQGAGNTIFHGGFGLINYQGIVKPAFHGYRMLNELGDEVLSRGPAGIVTRDKGTGKITALAYMYPPEVRESLPSCGNVSQALAVEALGKAMPLNVILTGLPPNAEFQIETLDKTHGYALPVYVAMGAPNPPTREQTAKLKEAAWATLKETVTADASGKLVVSRMIEPWSLVLIKQQ